MGVPDDIDLSSEQFVRLRELIYKSLGLYFEDNKVYFFKKRLEKRMAALALESVDDYLFHLRLCDASGSEMRSLASLITTNETYMFREYEQLETFSNYSLPEVLEAKTKSGDHSIRIWSAGCASGEEPYTLAIILREVLEDPDRWQIYIHATDIDDTVLKMAKEAVYGERSVRPVPEEYFARHLEVVPQGYRVRRKTADLVHVEYLNLYDQAAMRRMRRFDFVFCRNVLIYFDDRSRKQVVDCFYEALNPGGYVFLGHSESIGRISSAFELVRKGDRLAYRK